MVMVVILLISVILIRCTMNKVAIIKKVFVERMENEGYTIADATD